MENTITKKSWKSIIILSIIILTALLRVVYVFNVVKEGYHSDETWSYGLANGYYNPFLYTTNDVFNDAIESAEQNINEWISGQVIKDYMQVENEHRFAYDSVWYNQSKDQLPPLYYAVLHTVCSFFPETFSFAYGLCINLVFLIVSIIFLYKLAKLIFKDDMPALAVCFLYALCSGCLYTFMYIRMYAMTTMFLIIAVYVNVKVLLEEKITKKLMCALAVSTMLGALTHYIFLFFMFFFMSIVCIYYIMKKQWRKLFIHALMVLLGVGMMIAVFPTSLQHILGRNGSKGALFKMPDRIIWAYLFNGIFREVFGINTPVYRSVTWMYFVGGILLLAVILLLLGFVMRNEEWFKSFINELKLWIQGRIQKNSNIDGRIACIMIAMLAGTVGEIFIVLITTYIISMKQYADRYVFCTYPVICIIAVAVIMYLVKILTDNKNIIMITVSLAVFIFLTLAYRDYVISDLYKFPYNGEGMSLEDIPEDCDVIAGVTIPWLLVTYPEYVMDCNQVYFWDLFPYRDLDRSLKALPDDGREVYFLYDKTYGMLYEKDGEQVDEYTVNNFLGLNIPENIEVDNIDVSYKDIRFKSSDIFDVISNIKGIERIQYMGTAYNYGRPIDIYRLR